MLILSYLKCVKLLSMNLFNAITEFPVFFFLYLKNQLDNIPLRFIWELFLVITELLLLVKQVKLTCFNLACIEASFVFSQDAALMCQSTKSILPSHVFPNRDTGDVSEKVESPPVEAVTDDDLEKPPEKPEVMVSRSERQVQLRVDSALWQVINQVCVS